MVIYVIILSFLFACSIICFLFWHRKKTPLPLVLSIFSLLLFLYLVFLAVSIDRYPTDVHSIMVNDAHVLQLEAGVYHNNNGLYPSREVLEKELVHLKLKNPKTRQYITNIISITSADSITPMPSYIRKPCALAYGLNAEHTKYVIIATNENGEPIITLTNSIKDR
jgi:hypothetical protein